MSLIILSYVYLKNVVDMRKIFYCKQEKKNEELVLVVCFPCF